MNKKLIALPDMKPYINLASEKLGAQVVFASDDFFADKGRMIQDSEPKFIEDLYDEHGKWMDGWESRRRRHGGHDHAIIKLAYPGTIDFVDVDTSHFTGNFPPRADLSGCLSETPPYANTEWHNILPKIDLEGDRHHYFQINEPLPFNYVKLCIYPDGGIARLRLYGKVFYEPQADEKAHLEISALENGGEIVDYNDAHYGNVAAILKKGRGVDMGDGWETRRRRVPGNDWIVIKLRQASLIKSIEVDTAHYKGNYPDQCSVEAGYMENFTTLPEQESDFWKPILGKNSLEADSIHRFDKKSVIEHEPVNLVRLSIYPDGGVSRFRLFGCFVDDKK